MRTPGLSLLLLCAAIGGCGHLLPQETHSDRSAFDSFESARSALEQVVPFATTIADLRALGFDVKDSANVTLIPYPDLVSRLAPNPNVQLTQLDAGIRECILARMACQAYEFRLGEQHRKRQGGFWGDFLNFKRTTAVSGWHLQALLVVLFRNYGGEPKVARTEVKVNPLGPLQPAGETGAMLTR
jgi:hypothetical protein